MKTIAIAELLHILKEIATKNSIYICVELDKIATKKSDFLKEHIQRILSGKGTVFLLTEERAELIRKKDIVCRKTMFSFNGNVRLAFIVNLLELIENYHSIEITSNDLLEMITVTCEKTSSQLESILIQSQNQ